LPVLGGLVLLAIGLLTSTFRFIPKATLAGLIICAMYYMLDFSTYILLWRARSKYRTSCPPSLDLLSLDPVYLHSDIINARALQKGNRRENANVLAMHLFLNKD